MDETEIRKRIEDYLPKRRKYLEDCNNIREKEVIGEIYPWDADEEIKELDTELKASDEKTKYDLLREKTKTDSDIDEIFERVFKEILLKD